MDEEKSAAGAAQSQSDEGRSETVRKIQAMPAMAVTPGAPLGKKEAEAVSRLLGEMRNRVDGRVATLPVNSIGKIIRHRGFDVSTIINDLAALFEGAVHAWSEPEILKEGHKEHPNIEAYHHYVNKFLTGGDEYFIRLTVREGNVGKKNAGDNRIHSAFISEVAIYKNDADSDRIRVHLPGEKNSASFIDKRLQEFFDSVKLVSQSVNGVENHEPTAPGPDVFVITS